MTTAVPVIDPQGRFSPTQVAAVLEVSRPTVYAAMNSGDMPYTLTKTQKRRILGSTILRYYHNH